MDSVEKLLASWENEPTISANFVDWRREPARPAKWVDLPVWIDSSLKLALKESGIEKLYLHQLEAWDNIRQKRNVVICTGTASGKTLCYDLPVIDQWLRFPASTALFLFPTKALAQDQKDVLAQLVINSCRHSGSQRRCENHTVAVYDGDTPVRDRPMIRSQARFLLTNPDMLHIAILPHHTSWRDFFQNLQFVIIDEIHAYRGVFGSHVANVIRRLNRVASFYGANPLFILTSATISNAMEHAGRLIDAPTVLVEQDSSPRGERNFIIYNPAIIDKKLGLRQSAMSESTRLASDLLAHRIQTIIFARTRRAVELILKELRAQSDPVAQLHGYRSGYLSSERRLIEQGLKQGITHAVVSTNALELGIDIGGVGAVILVGYPGTISATRQQAGRAGRRNESSVAIYIASANPLDQFLASHPEYLLDRNPEQALINPDHLLILLQHLRCASFELSFREDEGFGSTPMELFHDLMGYLQQEGVLHYTGGKYYWTADQYPADQVSLRSTSNQPVLLQSSDENDRQKLIGILDNESAPWMVHPQAIYFHQAQSYQVEDLNLEQRIAHLRPVQVDYYTEPQQQVNIQLLNLMNEKSVKGGKKRLGEILVVSQVVGYKRIQWSNRQLLGTYPLELPPSYLRTVAYWITLDQISVQILQSRGLWRNDANQYGPNWPRQRDLARKRDLYRCQVCGTPEENRAHHVHHKVPFRAFTSFVEANALENLVTLCPGCHQRVELAVRIRSGLAGLGYVLHQIAPLFLMCDVADLGEHVDPQSSMSGGDPTVILYDQIAAGIGLSETLYSKHEELIDQCYDLVNHCPCQDGCPGCVGPSGEHGIGGKRETLAILSLMAGHEIL